MAISSTLDKTASYVLIAVLILLPVVSHAGGLGVAPLVFILGLLGIVLNVRSDEPKLWFSLRFLALCVFFLWLCITALWSPYQPDDILTNYVKLFIMGLVFCFCPIVLKQTAKTKLVTLQRVFLTTIFMSAFLVFIDIWSNFKVTLFFNPASNPEEIGYRLKDAEMNLGHAITVLVLFSAPMTLLLKAYFKSWKLLTSLFFVLIVTASFLNNLWIGIFGLLTVFITMILASKYYRNMPRIVVFLAAFSVISAPLFAFLSSQIIEYDLSMVPLSWEHRLRMWAYCWPVILEQPIVGSGFDAARTFQEQWTARDGKRLTIVSLHPHNAGIHIWVETGLIGCMLATGVILSSLKRISYYSKTRERAVLLSGVIMAAVIISSTTYGAWQFWWWGSVFFSFGLIHFIPMKEA